MNIIAEQIKKTIESKIEARKEKKSKKEDIKIFSWSSFFAGEEYNQELAKHDKIKDNNIIEFSEAKSREKEFIENKIKEIANSSTSKQLIEQEKFPVIWFKNIDKIVDKSPLQKFLLAVFDPAQNSSLSIGGKTIDLSQFILIATSSTRDTGRLSNPLMSRLDCINVDTAKPKEFFWDKYFYPILIASLFTFLILILLLIYYSDRRETKKAK